MQKHNPITEPFGVLYGRDCIFLDDVKLTDNTDTLTLVGNLNGDLLRPPRQTDVPYRIIFSGLMAMQMLELDSWDDEYASSLDEIIESEWVSSLGGKVTTEHRHFCVVTYDVVFDVVCKQMTITERVSD